jgi:hypothetical protein
LPPVYPKDKAMKLPLLVCVLSLVATPALADLRVEFVEGAPKDRFILTNIGSCTLNPSTVTIDLSKTAGRLIFDVTGAGAGVNVFQPFEIAEGADIVQGQPDVSDGEAMVTLALAAMPIGARIVVTTDIDDTMGTRETMVNSVEFAGARVMVTGGGDDGADGAFTFANSVTGIVKLPDCVGA